MSNSEHFYERLPVIDRFVEVSKFDRYTPVPGEWLVVGSDIVNSTDAIERDKYKQVNMLGASVITAITNCYRPLKLPFVFGGDGAMICIPPGGTEQAREALTYLQRMAQEQFSLEMRAGIIPVSAIRKQDYDLKVARYRVSDHYYQAVFSGGGLSYAEQIIKEDPKSRWQVKPASGDGYADLSGLECRWKHQESRYDEIVTLLVVALADSEERQEQLYNKVIEKVDKIYCQGLICHPVDAGRLQLGFRWSDLSVEVKTRTFGNNLWEKIRYLLRLTYQQIAGALLMRFDIDTGETQWGQYKGDLRANSDYRKFDDLLRQVLSGTAEQRIELVDFLEKHYRAGELAYGLNRSPAILITCMVMKYQDHHFHFIDGTSGGYAEAARKLKKRLNKRNRAGSG